MGIDTERIWVVKKLEIHQMPGRYHIVYYNKKKYLLDNSTLTPKSYYWGKRQKELTAIMHHIPNADTLFNEKNIGLGQMAIVLMVQPVAKILYSTMESYLGRTSGGADFFIKLLLFMTSIIVGFIIYTIIFNRVPRNIEKAVKGTPKVKIVFHTDGSRTFGVARFFAMIVLVSFILYMTTSENILLMLNGLFSFGVLVLSYKILPIGVSIREGHLTVRDVYELESQELR